MIIIGVIGRLMQDAWMFLFHYQLFLFIHVWPQKNNLQVNFTFWDFENILSLHSCTDRSRRCADKKCWLLLNRCQMPNVIKEGDVGQGHNGTHLQDGGVGDLEILSYGPVWSIIFLRSFFSLCLWRILVLIHCQNGTHLQNGGAELSYGGNSKFSLNRPANFVFKQLEQRETFICTF